MTKYLWGHKSRPAPWPEQWTGNFVIYICQAWDLNDTNEQLILSFEEYEKGTMFWLSDSAHCFKQKPENKKEKKKRMRVGVCENFVRGGQLAVRVLSGTEKAKAWGFAFAPNCCELHYGT